DFCNNAWVYHGTWQPVDNILMPPIYINASFLLVKIDALLTQLPVWVVALDPSLPLKKSTRLL
ncbi:MAG: hypothetical protein ACRC11_02850, partial [Xenococcaceae cyanobacterium]